MFNVIWLIVTGVDTVSFPSDLRRGGGGQIGNMGGTLRHT